MSDNYKNYVHNEFSGKGKITFQDGINYTVNFQIYLYNSGSLVGSLWFTTVDNRLYEEVNRNETFTIGGGVQSGLTISAKGCAFYSFTPIEVINFPNPLLTARFIISRLKIYDITKLNNLEEEQVTLCFEFGILNYYSPTIFLLKTEIGEIQSYNILSDEEIAIFRNSFISFISTLLRIKPKAQKSLDDVKQTVFNIIKKVLELTSFALTTEHRWSYYKIYLNDFSSSQFAYSECINQLPRAPESHNNIADSRLEDFLNLSYNNYNTNKLNKKYNFSVALAWYLDSLSLKYEVTRYISASTALESILEVFSPDSGLILSRKDFEELSKKIIVTIKNELGDKVSQEDIESMKKSLPNINRRHYRTKVEGLLESLGILDDETKDSLNDIISVRNEITHTGRSKILNEKVAQTYLKLFNLLTKIFFKILLPDKHVFTQEFHNMTWKVLR